MVRAVILAALICSALFVAPASAIVVTLSAYVEGNERPVVVGESNLPDGTIVIVTLTRRSDGYYHQIITSVQGGAFRAGPFGLNTRPLATGYYDITLLVPVAWKQPRSVQHVIGKNGEKLEGPLVVMSEAYRVNVVEAHIDLIVGNPPPEEDTATRAREQEKRHSDYTESCRDLCDVGQSFADERQERFDWEACYRSCLDREP
jgi:hypothetical protein